MRLSLHKLQLYPYLSFDFLARLYRSKYFHRLRRIPESPLTKSPIANVRFGSASTASHNNNVSLMKLQLSPQQLYQRANPHVVLNQKPPSSKRAQNILFLEGVLSGLPLHGYRATETGKEQSVVNPPTVGLCVFISRCQGSILSV